MLMRCFDVMRTTLYTAGLALFFLLAPVAHSVAQTLSFTNALARADLAVKRGDFQGALRIYDAATNAQAGNATNLCTLARRYSDIAYLNNSMALRKEMIARALACSRQAVKDAPSYATAHACVAVCYARICKFSDVKTELADSRLLKLEADKAIALDPNLDIAYYVLGRWNYGIANAGLLSRAYVKVVYGGLPHASLEDAALDFQKACKLAPNSILNHAGLAMAYDALGEKKLEIAELEKCFTLKPLGPEDTDALRDAKKKLAALK